MINKTEILKNYVCKNPFTYLDIQEDGDFICCPSWCSTNISAESERLSWNSDHAKMVRLSMLEGNFRYCDHDVCPALNLLINQGEVRGPLVKKESADFLIGYEDGPEEIVFGWDRSCNLSCPSCRSNIIKNNGSESFEHKKKQDIIREVENKFGKTVKKLIITGSGDPFYSRVYRDYLVNFDKSKYPALKSIQIVTNGNMLTERVWTKMKASPYIKMIEISIDSGDPYNYENRIRIGGKWDVLMKNLAFISTIKTLDEVIVSMVVSENNFIEMKRFYDKMISIFDRSVYGLTINFRQHVYWGTGKYSKKEVEDIQVFNQSHPRHDEFMIEVKKIHGLPHVSHNFHHLMHD
jgi:sulfatase maturation enzyme AslB (radical SAM superfamily)